jgi:hypothetical protein
MPVLAKCSARVRISRDPWGNADASSIFFLISVGLILRDLLIRRQTDLGILGTLDIRRTAESH